MLFVRDSIPLLDPRNTNAHYNAIVNTVLNKDPDFDYQYVDEREVSPELSKHNVSHAGETFYLTDESFDFVVTKKVQQLPYNIDGIGQYEISCEEKYCKQ